MQKATKSGGKENIAGSAEKVESAVSIDPGSESEKKPIQRSEVVLPLEPLTLVDCVWREDKKYPARIIERRKVERSDDEWEYYVHYRGWNRRMDEWVSLDRLDLETVIPPEPFDPSDPKARKRRLEEMYSDDEEEQREDLDPKENREHKEGTKLKTVQKVELGRFLMDTWYFSPLPKNFHNIDTLYVCEYDMALFVKREAMLRHLKKVRILHPPGVEIYRHKGISVFEVDGKTENQYCRNLCYIAKLFLDHKELDFDVDIFLFYVLCECDERGAHIVGYFSKEKALNRTTNLACILTLPAHQRKGYGKFLISFSYELSKIEKMVGSPERPLSDLGYVSYRGYWTRALLTILKDREGSISIKDLTEMTMIHSDDIISTLQHLNMIRYIKGQHVICAAPHAIESHLKACGSPGLLVEPSKIVWTPFKPPGSDP